MSMSTFFPLSGSRLRWIDNTHAKDVIGFAPMDTAEAVLGEL
jgi:hypothetical protein